MTDVVSTQAPDTGSLKKPGAARPALGRPLGERIQQLSLPGVFVATIVFFTIARPHVFPTTDNARAILQQDAPLLILLGGLSIVLSMREFDLSFGYIAGASGALAVQAMASWHLPTGLAVLVGLLLGTGLGAVNGVLVGYLRLPSFIGTLATGSIIQGVMSAISFQTIFQGITSGYKNLTLQRVAGIPVDLIVIAVVLTLIGFVLRYSVFGRHAAALGDNPEAARIAGINIRRTKLIGFTAVGTCAGAAGVLLTSAAAQYYPDPGSSLLLAGYAAAFLSLSMGRGWRFNVGGAVLGSVFLACVTTGVTMLNRPTWVAQLLQGVVLLVAVMALTRRQVAH